MEVSLLVLTVPGAERDSKGKRQKAGSLPRDGEHAAAAVANANGRKRGKGLNNLNLEMDSTFKDLFTILNVRSLILLFFSFLFGILFSQNEHELHPLPNCHP